MIDWSRSYLESVETQCGYIVDFPYIFSNGNVGPIGGNSMGLVLRVTNVSTVAAGTINLAVSASDGRCIVHDPLILVPLPAGGSQQALCTLQIVDNAHQGAYDITVESSDGQSVTFTVVFGDASLEPNCVIDAGS
jgi:uncharacterized membrane protein